jgi:hypothetical protein
MAEVSSKRNLEGEQAEGESKRAKAGEDGGSGGASKQGSDEAELPEVLNTRPATKAKLLWLFTTGKVIILLSSLDITQNRYPEGESQSRNVTPF